MSDVHSIIGIATVGDLSAYDVRTFTENRSADNKAFVSSATDGKTERVAGNLDKTWDISLYAKVTEFNIPTALDPGAELTCEIPAGAASLTMIIDTAVCEVNWETGELISYALTCSAVSSASYI